MTSSRATLVSAASAVAVALVGAVFVGCPAVDVVVAQQSLPDASEAGPPSTDGGMRTCTSMGDCAPEEYCQKDTCDSAEGVCLRTPFNCPSAFEGGVCGCDGVLYWNDCLRARDGVPSSATECGHVVAYCGDSKQPACPVRDAVCALYDPNGGGNCALGRGRCWVLPDTCPADAGGPNGPAGPPAASCGPPPFMCMDLCDALSSGNPYGRALPGQCP
jgi:hypothetical protein